MGLIKSALLVGGGVYLGKRMEKNKHRETSRERELSQSPNYQNHTQEVQRQAPFQPLVFEQPRTMEQQQPQLSSTRDVGANPNYAYETYTIGQEQFQIITSPRQENILPPWSNRSSKSLSQEPSPVYSQEK
jgi:hypothetical protein